MLKPPVILLAFANDQKGDLLRGIAEEQAAILRALKPLESKKLLEVVTLPAAKDSDIFEAFRQYKDRIKIFHYGGHAQDLQLLLSGSVKPFDMSSFADYLSHQKGLELVVMNGCATAAQQKVLQAANISHLVLTDMAIEDETAKMFAEAYYGHLASGRDVGRSFEEASAIVRNNRGGERRSLIWSELDEENLTGLPWRIYHHPPNRERFHLRVRRRSWPLVALITGAALLTITAYFLKPLPEPFDLTLIVQDAQGKPTDALAKGDKLLTTDKFLTDTLNFCRLALMLDGEPKWGEIDQQGNVYFRQIDPRFEGQPVPIKMEACFWELADSLGELEIHPPNTSLRITRTATLCTITGTTKYKFGAPLANLRIQVRALPDASQLLAEGRSDAEGRFAIQVPLDRCARQYLLQAEHPDQHYPVRDTLYPESGEHLFFLTPIQNATP